ncbi:MAG: hypothetical protein EZS28_016153 [Streblomastix strix]|uniref:Uncharacterized protein n=1 Tax=Streblomastix strix TaxID=222440 RepID=A0A5J4W0B5_9EUKA|nr:MAG: hypothetical protein EZS28_016153 [Streblomastix strix]
MENSMEQEYTGSYEINNIPGIELEHGINDAINNQTNEETSDGSINQTCTVNTAAAILNCKKRGKADWTNPINKSSVHTRRSSYHVHELRNEQMGKEDGMGLPDQIIEKSADRVRVVDNANQEQQTQEYKNTQDLSNDNNWLIFREKGNNLIYTWRANIATQRFALSEGKDGQYNSMLQFDQRQSQSGIQKINRQNTLIHRGTSAGNQVQIYFRNQQHRSGFSVEARNLGRLLNRQINAAASARGTGDLHYNRLLCNEEKCKIPQIFFNRKRRYNRELGRNGTIVVVRNTITTLSNLTDSSCHMQNGIGVGKMDINSTNVERTDMVNSSNVNYNTLEGVRRQKKRPQGRSVDEEEQSETIFGEDWDFLGRRGEKGEQLFKQCRLDTGLTGQSIQGIIDGWHGSWKRHACSLTIFAEYWAQQSGTVL